MTEHGEHLKREEQAASALLDRGVRWKLPAPWWMRLLGRQHLHLTVTPLKYGTLLELSRAWCAMGASIDEPPDDLHGMMRQHAPALCRAVAVCLLNSRWRILLGSRWLGRFLMHRVTPGQVFELMVFVATFSNAEAFWSTIRLIGDMRVTKPKSLSHEEQGS